jgi:RimJ/RimL family protein N-acetyltransferase
VIRLERGRVVLRGFAADELEEAWERRLRSTAAVGTPDRERFLERLARSGEWADDQLDLAVVVDGQVVGDLGGRVGRRMLPPGVCELGVELWEERRGAGIGTEAIGLLTEWLHGNGFPRVQGGTDVRNAPMRRVFEKLGYELEGTMRSFMPDGDARADYVLYAHVAP